MSREQNLMRALAMCLEGIHDYFGLTEAEMAVALEDAATNPDWLPHNAERWRRIAYPPPNDDGTQVERTQVVA